MPSPDFTASREKDRVYFVTGADEHGQKIAIRLLI
jgi:methionyl-tRNA synthetase